MNQRYVSEMYAISCLRYLVITKVLCGCELNCTENIKKMLAKSNMPCKLQHVPLVNILIFILYRRI